MVFNKQKSKSVTLTLKEQRTKYFNISMAMILLMMCSVIASTRLNLTVIDPDLLWHWKEGERYLESGISTLDHFSWQPNLIWTTAEWLYEVFIYKFTNLFSVTGFVWLLAFTFWVIPAYSIKRNGLKHPFIFIAVFGIIALFPRNMYNRPSEFSTIILLILIYKFIYDRGNRRSDIVKDIKTVTLFTLSSIFLANFHGGSLITLYAVMLIVVAISFIHGLMFKLTRVVDWHRAIVGLITIVVGFLASLLNPMGFEMYKVGALVPNMPSTKFINEWQPWDMSLFNGVVILSMILMLGFSKRFKNLERDTLSVTAIICAFTILSIRTQRVATYLAGLIILFGIPYINEFYEYIVSKVFNRCYTNHTGHEIKSESSAEDSKQMTVTNKVLYMIIWAILLVFSIYWIQSGIPESQNTIDKMVAEGSQMSTEMIPYLEQEGVDMDTKIFTGYTSGNWLIWNGYPSFVDSRQQPFTPEISEGNDSLNDFIKIIVSHQQAEDAMALFDKYDMEYVYWSVDEMGSDISNKLIASGEWEEVVHIKTSKHNEYLFKRKA